MMKTANEILTVILNAIYTAYKVVTSKLFYVPVITIALFSSIYWFADNYQLRTPVLVTIQLPYEKRAKDLHILSPLVSAQTVEDAKPLTPKEVMESYRLSPVLKTIRVLESSDGVNDGCIENGQINGFGYRQNSSEFKCYESFDKVVDYVNEWFEDRLNVNGNDIIEAACYYNTGVPNQDTCHYSQNFVRVLVSNL